jgi:glyoxylase-like metal-dependent hydrolase (beta-lactamase superfamily II)
MPAPQVEQVGTGVHLVRGAHVNWVLVEDGDAVTLIDTGYPRDAEKLLASLAHIGRGPADVSAVLLTHGHPDHIGSAERFRTEHDAAVYAHRDEAPNARGERIEQVSELTIARNLWRPRVMRWLVDVVRLGGPKPQRLGVVTTYANGTPLDVPGHPVPLHTPGHTSGHTCFHLPERGVLVAGDAAMTAHAIVPDEGPQLLPDMFNVDTAKALTSLDVLEPLTADVVLVGHGPAFRGNPAEFVRQVRASRA